VPHADAKVLGHGLDVDEVRVPVSFSHVSHGQLLAETRMSSHLLLVCWKPKRDESVLITECQG